MRVSIPKGYHAPIERLMAQLQTDDPALAVIHIVGCWLASGGCPGQAIGSTSEVSPTGEKTAAADDLDDIIDWSVQL